MYIIWGNRFVSLVVCFLANLLTNCIVSICGHGRSKPKAVDFMNCAHSLLPWTRWKIRFFPCHSVCNWYCNSVLVQKINFPLQFLCNWTVHSHDFHRYMALNFELIYPLILIWCTSVCIQMVLAHGKIHFVINHSSIIDII